QIQVSREIVGEKNPPAANLAMTETDATEGEKANPIAPLKKKKRTKCGTTA
ncbi:hypothetical protein A2U01_0098485, partial [Trifolium medium]|nr:hypothetical protein [Trifolium medium]